MTGMWRNEHAQDMCCDPWGAGEGCETLGCAKPRYCNANSPLLDGNSCFLESLGWAFLQNPILAQAGSLASTAVIAGLLFSRCSSRPFAPRPSPFFLWGDGASCASDFFSPSSNFVAPITSGNPMRMRAH